MGLLSRVTALQIRPALLVMALMVLGVIPGTEAVSHQDDRYAPSRFGIPDSIGGHPVLAVLTEDNFACMRAGEKRLVLQSLQPSMEGALRDFQNRPTESLSWEADIVGPTQTRHQLISELERQHRYFAANGCSSLALPNANSCSATGECKHSGEPAQGFVIVQNSGIDQDPYTKNNGQSVVLVAPEVGTNQEDLICNLAKFDIRNFPQINPICESGYSAFLNNGMTDGGWFLQVGFMFANKPLSEPCILSGCAFGDGLVVWAGALTEGVKDPHLEDHDLFETPGVNGQPATIPYVAGHEYFTTITYTNNKWWTCAADMADASTYQCHLHDSAKGAHLIKSINGTNIFLENGNSNSNWWQGFTNQWPAHDAVVHLQAVDNSIHSWPKQDVWTVDRCQAPYPAARGVVGSLVPDPNGKVNNGWAFLTPAGAPLRC